MPMYRVAAQGATALTDDAIAEILTTSARRAKIREIKIVLRAATATEVGLIRSSTVGVLTTSVAGQLLDPADTLASTSLLGTAWSTQPIIGTAYMDRHYFAASAGAMYAWFWPDQPLVVPISASLCLWNFGAGTAAANEVTVTFEE